MQDIYIYGIREEEYLGTTTEVRGSSAFEVPRTLISKILLFTDSGGQKYEATFKINHGGTISVSGWAAASLCVINLDKVDSFAGSTRTVDHTKFVVALKATLDTDIEKFFCDTGDITVEFMHGNMAVFTFSVNGGSKDYPEGHVEFNEEVFVPTNVQMEDSVAGKYYLTAMSNDGISQTGLSGLPSEDTAPDTAVIDKLTVMRGHTPKERKTGDPLVFGIPDVNSVEELVPSDAGGPILSVSDHNALVNVLEGVFNHQT